jgi:hypothetical protein
MARPYLPVTRVGNWSEELELENARKTEYLHNKEKGLLVTQQKIKNTELVELIPTEDGYVHYGAIVMIKNAKTDGVLATDVNDRLRRVGVAFAVTTAPAFPVARSVFTIESLDAQNDVLQYGDKLYISTTPYLKDLGSARVAKLYVSSHIVTPDIYSKCSHFQEVCTTTEKDYSTTWQVIHYDPKLRLEYEGSPVEMGATVVIKHCQTGVNLGSSTIPYRNDFGLENEVFCRTFLDQHVSSW